MKHPFSKLQRELYKLLDPSLDFQIHCIVYPMKSRWGTTDLPRYWITLDSEIIWDFPKDFVLPGKRGSVGGLKNLSQNKKRRFYPYHPGVSEISQLLREYIDTPKEELYAKHFANDEWGLANILKAADRRIGQRRLKLLQHKTKNIAAQRIIALRLKDPNEDGKQECTKTNM